MSDFIVTVGEDRRAEFLDVFGTESVPVVSPYPLFALLDGAEDPVAVYILAYGELDEDQRTRLIQHLAQKFGGEEADIQAEIAARGMPIKAAGTSLSILHPLKYMD